jgi:4-amino-4-deoxy-L-arabinose transferase-like glycosyltransferase
MAAAAVLFVYVMAFQGLTAAGLLGPDEPRYAWIGREMAASGDWLTPRLWGDPWHEKPPLLYWMAGVFFRLGFGDDLAPRLPVALASILFLAAYAYLLSQLFGWRAALLAALFLASSLGWLGFGFVAATDLPLAATFSLSMLVWVRWLDTEQRGLLALGAGLLGLAVLAKGLVPLVLALPFLGAARRRIPQLLGLLPTTVFLLVAAPWYAGMLVAHGREFFDEFFLRHHFSRFATEELQHQQPFWFYVPVLLAGVFPWTPLWLLWRKLGARDGRILFLLAWFFWGLLFFSAATNKLPGYVLPLLPAWAALTGIALDRTARAPWALAFCALLLGVIPLIASVLPEALRFGLRQASGADLGWGWMAAAAVLAVLVWSLERQNRRRWAVLILASSVTAGTSLLRTRVLPILDERVSARRVWHEISHADGALCWEPGLHRSYQYGLFYYSRRVLPVCPEHWDGQRIVQRSRDRPRLEPAAGH